MCVWVVRGGGLGQQSGHTNERHGECESVFSPVCTHARLLFIQREKHKVNERKGGKCIGRRMIVTVVVEMSSERRCNMKTSFFKKLEKVVHTPPCFFSNTATKMCVIFWKCPDGNISPPSLTPSASSKVKKLTLSTGPEGVH